MTQQAVSFLDAVQGKVEEVAVKTTEALDKVTAKVEAAGASSSAAVLGPSEVAAMMAKSVKSAKKKYAKVVAILGGFIKKSSAKTDTFLARQAQYKQRITELERQLEQAHAARKVEPPVQKPPPPPRPAAENERQDEDADAEDSEEEGERKRFRFEPEPSRGCCSLGCVVVVLMVLLNLSLFAFLAYAHASHDQWVLKRGLQPMTGIGTFLAGSFTSFASKTTELFSSMLGGSAPATPVVSSGPRPGMVPEEDLFECRQKVSRLERDLDDEKAAFSELRSEFNNLAMENDKHMRSQQHDEHDHMHADEHGHSHLDHGDGACPAKLTVLESQVADLEMLNSALRTNYSRLQEECNSASTAEPQVCDCEENVQLAVSAVQVQLAECQASQAAPVGTDEGDATRELEAKITLLETEVNVLQEENNLCTEELIKQSAAAEDSDGATHALLVDAEAKIASCQADLELLKAAQTEAPSSDGPAEIGPCEIKLQETAEQLQESESLVTQLTDSLTQLQTDLDTVRASKEELEETKQLQHDRIEALLAEVDAMRDVPPPTNEAVGESEPVAADCSVLEAQVVELEAELELVRSECVDASAPEAPSGELDSACTKRIDELEERLRVLQEDKLRLYDQNVEAREQIETLQLRLESGGTGADCPPCEACDVHSSRRTHPSRPVRTEVSLHMLVDALRPHVLQREFTAQRSLWLLLIVFIDLLVFHMLHPRQSRFSSFVVWAMWTSVAAFAYVNHCWIPVALCGSNALLSFIYFANPRLVTGISIKATVS